MNQRVTFRLRGRSHSFTPSEVVKLLQNHRPEFLSRERYGVRIGDDIWPCKQIVSVITHLPRLAFSSKTAWDLLYRLGFTIVERDGTTGLIVTREQGRAVV